MASAPKPGLRFNTFYLVFALLGVVALHDAWQSYTQIETIPYSEFRKLTDADKIEEVAVGSKFIRGTLKEPGEAGKKQFVTTRIDPLLAEQLKGSSAKVYGLVESTFLRDLLSWILPALIFVGIWIFVMRRFGGKGGAGGFMAIGKSKAKVYVEPTRR